MPLLGLLTVPGWFTSVAELVAVEGPLLDGLDSEASGRGLSNWEKRGGEGSRRVSEVPVSGRGESGVSLVFGCSVRLDWGSC